MECTGDLRIQEILDVTILDHESNLCTTNGSKFEDMKEDAHKKLLHDIKKAAPKFKDSNKNLVDCSSNVFFKLKEIKEDIQAKCIDSNLNQSFCNLRV